MSYAWHLAGDAKADLTALDPWLQEDVLDELDRLSADPSDVRADPLGFAAHDFERTRAAMSHVIFVRLHRDDARRVLTILAVADCCRSVNRGD